MFYKRLIGAAAAAALVATPVMAAPAAPGAAPAPAVENVDADSDLRRRGGLLIPIAVLVALGVAVYFLFLDDEPDTQPLTP